MSSSPQESPVRSVRLDLKSFFSDYRRQSCIALKSNWATIKDVIEHVQQTFELGEIIILTSSDEYLPPSEPIDIIASGEKLRIIHPSEKDTTKPNDDQPTKVEQSTDTGEVSGGKCKRKRTHKRKLPTLEKTTQVALPKLQHKVAKTDAGSPAKTSHVFFDDESNAIDLKSLQVKFVNFIDSLDASKARVVCTSAKKECGTEKTNKVEAAGIETPASVEIAAM